MEFAVDEEEARRISALANHYGVSMGELSQNVFDAAMKDCMDSTLPPISPCIKLQATKRNELDPGEYLDRYFKKRVVESA